MLRLIPDAAHRAALRLAHRLRVGWWRWRRPTISGVRIIAQDASGRVLLIRHSYGSGKWMLPGGGLARGENAVLAARRELAEETGCVLAHHREIALSIEPLHGATNRVHVVAGVTGDTPRPDGREVIEATFFAADALPAPLVAGLADDLTGWLAAADPAARDGAGPLRPSDPA